MKRIVFAAIILSVAFVCHGQNYRKYPYKSGKVEYVLSGNTRGRQVTYWDEYGYKEVTIDETTTTFFGQTTTENSTTLTIGQYQYEWNNQSEQVFKTSNPIAETWEENNYDEDDVEEFSIESMKALGYEKIGVEKIIGKTCDIYKGIGKIWVWNGVPLKTEVKLLGTTSVIEAKDIDTNCKVPASVFELPKDKEVVENMEYSSEQLEEQAQEEHEEEYEEVDPDEIKEGVENALKTLFGGN